MVINIKDRETQQTIDLRQPSEFVMPPQVGHHIILLSHPHILRVEAVYHRLGAQELVVVTVPVGPVTDRYAPASW